MTSDPYEVAEGLPGSFHAAPTDAHYFALWCWPDMDGGEPDHNSAYPLDHDAAGAWEYAAAGAFEALPRLITLALRVAEGEPPDDLKAYAQAVLDEIDLATLRTPIPTTGDEDDEDDEDSLQLDHNP